ncbi:MAG: insulinase family protein [Bacteroidales bacterium]|jgi:predicted Zn-dependent peptidase|nr:insulinase family protein [Bacteroidales bacterium]
MKLAFKKISSPVAYCALSTAAGTRHEGNEYNGLAHLIEHMLFKGTEKRSSASINNILEKEGGELNAYTTKEEIVIMATVLLEDLPKAIDLITELAFKSTFPEDELEKEKDVVYDEIITYKDSPSESIYENFEELLFEGSPLQATILGEKKSLKKITSDILRNYRKKEFIPENMSISVVADKEPKEVKKIVRKSLGKYYGTVDIADCPKESGESDSYESLNDNIKALGAGHIFHKVILKKNHQANCIVGCPAYSFYGGKKRIALALIANILGGPASNAWLNTNLREKNALVYNVEANYSSYSDTGVFSIYFGCEKQLLEKCMALVKKQIDKIVNRELSETELKRAKKQFLGQLFIANDNPEAMSLSMAKSMQVYGRVFSFESTEKLINSLTPEYIREVAAEAIKWDRMSVLIYE